MAKIFLVCWIKSGNNLSMPQHLENESSTRLTKENE